MDSGTKMLIEPIQFWLVARFCLSSKIVSSFLVASSTWKPPSPSVSVISVDDGAGFYDVRVDVVSRSTLASSSLASKKAALCRQLAETSF